MPGMKIYTEIIGNIFSPQWRDIASGCQTEYVDLDQWTAQKSRFVVPGRNGGEYAVSLRRHSRLLDGDIIEYVPEQNRIVALRIRLNDVMVLDLRTLAGKDTQTVMHIAFELGHAVGNQHWPAVVKGTEVFVPLTVDRKVMESVMRTHHIEDVQVGFRSGEQVIPYLAPHEVRRLFGGTEPDGASHSHVHTHSC